MQRVVASALTIGGLCAGGASAQVLFQDDFENEAVGTVLGAPLIGSWSEGVGSGSAGVVVVGSPALGTRSVRLARESAPPNGPSNADLRATSISGAIVAGQTVEVKWSLNHEFVHNFNNPMQVAIGHAGSASNNDSTFVTFSDVNGSNYAYYSGPGQFGSINNSFVKPSTNTPDANEGKWDTLRAVLSYTQLNATQLSGTLDLFVSINGAAEVQLANDALLQTTTVPSDNLVTLGVDESTAMQVRFVKGPSSGLDFYDNVSVTVVPEPASMGLAAMALGMLVRRNRK